MEGERVEFISFIFGIGFIFIISVALFVFIGFFNQGISGLAVSSGVDVEFATGGVFANNSSVVNESDVGIPPDNVFVPVDIVYNEGIVDSEGNYVGEEERNSFLLWGLVILCVILLVVIIVIIVLIILKSRKGGEVYIVSERSFAPEKNVVPEIALKLVLPVQPVSPVQPVLPVQPVSPVQSVSPDSVMPKSVKGISSLEFIKNYSISFSTDPEDRIRYFLNNGNQFISKKDFVGARQLYSWIVEEYNKMNSHDDVLYREILDFKQSIS